MAAGSVHTSKHGTASSSQRVRRKPIPVFPYSAKYPQFDPADPFAPMTVLRSRNDGRFTSDSEGFSDSSSYFHQNTHHLRPDRPVALDRHHSDARQPSEAQQSEMDAAQNRRRSRSVVLTPGHPNARDSALLNISTPDFHANIEPASPIPAKSPIPYEPAMLAPPPRHEPVRRDTSPPPPMTPDDSSASEIDGSVHYAQRVHRRVPSTLAPSTIYSHRAPTPDSPASHSSVRRRNFFVSTPATRGDPSPMPSDGYTSEEWHSQVRKGADSPLPVTLPPPRVVVSPKHANVQLAESYPARQVPPSRHVQPHTMIDFGPRAESPESMHTQELENSVVRRAQLEVEASENPQPLPSSSHMPRLSSGNTTRSSLSSGHSKRTPSLRLRIPGKPAAFSTPSPARTFLAPRPQLVSTPSRETADSPLRHSMPVYSPTITDGDDEAIVQTAQIAHWSPAPVPVPPPFPVASTTSDTKNTGRPAPERRFSAFVAQVVPARLVPTTSLRNQLAEARKDMTSAQSMKKSEPVPPVPSHPMTKTAATTRRSPSPPAKAIAHPRTSSPPRATSTPRPPSPPKRPSPPPRSVYRSSTPKQEPSFARPTAVSSSANTAPRPTRTPSPPRNRYEAAMAPSSSKTRVPEARGTASVDHARGSDRSAQRPTRTPSPPRVTVSPPPRKASPILRVPSPEMRATAQSTRTLSPPPTRPQSPPVRPISPPPTGATLASAIPSMLRDALHPSQSVSSFTTTASNRQLPPLPRAPPSTPAVPHFTEAVMAALERASPPEASSVLASAAAQESTTAFVARSSQAKEKEKAGAQQEQKRAQEERVRLEQRRVAEEQRRVREEQRRVEEERKRIEEERRRLEEERRRVEDARRRAEEERRRVDEQRRFEEQRRIEEQRRVEEQRRLEEQQRRREDRRRYEEARRIEQERRMEEERRMLELERREEEERRRMEEERLRMEKEQEERRHAEEEQRLALEERRRTQEKQVERPAEKHATKSKSAGVNSRTPARAFLVDPATVALSPQASHEMMMMKPNAHDRSALSATDFAMTSMSEDEGEETTSSSHGQDAFRTSPVPTVIASPPHSPVPASRMIPLPKPKPVRGMSDKTILSMTSTIVDGTEAGPSVISKENFRVTNPDEDRPPAFRRNSPAQQSDDLHAQARATSPPPVPVVVPYSHKFKSRDMAYETTAKDYEIDEERVGADVNRSDTRTTSTLHPSDTSWEALSNRAADTKNSLFKSPAPNAAFGADVPLSPTQLAEASQYYVIGENGRRVQFGSLWRDRKTIVIFLRHFWCPFDQDYMYSIARQLNFASLMQEGVGIVLIGCGAPGMLRSYRQIYRAPVEMYTDPSGTLQRALGMTLRTNDAGPEIERGGYVRHGVVGGIAMVVLNALRVGMPVFEKGGDPALLGGEFVLGPGMQCTFAHRMRNTRNHTLILAVAAAAGMRDMPVANRSLTSATNTSLAATTTLAPTTSRSTAHTKYGVDRRKSVRGASISPPLPGSQKHTQMIVHPAYDPIDLSFDTRGAELLASAISKGAGVFSEDEAAFQREHTTAEVVRIRQRKERERALAAARAAAAGMASESKNSSGEQRTTIRRKPLPTMSTASRAWTTDAEDMYSGPVGAHDDMGVLSDDQHQLRPRAHEEDERPPPTPEKERTRPSSAARRHNPAQEHHRRGTQAVSRKPVATSWQNERGAKQQVRRAPSAMTGASTDGGPGREAVEMYVRAQGRLMQGYA